jgi:hypothetical protein
MSQPFSFIVDVGNRCEPSRIAIAAWASANAFMELSSNSGSDQARFGRMPKARKSRITNCKDLLPRCGFASNREGVLEFHDVVPKPERQANQARS